MRRILTWASAGKGNAPAQSDPALGQYENVTGAWGRARKEGGAHHFGWKTFDR